MMPTFVDKWGMAVAKRRHTQLPDLLMDYWREIGLSRTERDNIFYIIRFQDDPNFGAIPSAKELAIKSGVCYETTRANLKRLAAHKKEGGKGLLTPVVLKGGRIRYSTMALRRELEKIDERQRQGQPLEMVKPAKVRPAPKPEPKALSDEEFFNQADEAPEVEELDTEATRDWERIKASLAEDYSMSRSTKMVLMAHLADTEALRKEDSILIVECDAGILRRLEGHKAEIDYHLLRFFGSEWGIQFVERKRKKKLGPLARLAVATVGV